MTLQPRWERFLELVSGSPRCDYVEGRAALLRVLSEHDAERAGPTPRGCGAPMPPWVCGETMTSGVVAQCDACAGPNDSTAAPLYTGENSVFFSGVKREQAQGHTETKTDPVVRVVGASDSGSAGEGVRASRKERSLPEKAGVGNQALAGPTLPAEQPAHDPRCHVAVCGFHGCIRRVTNGKHDGRHFAEGGYFGDDLKPAKPARTVDAAWENHCDEDAAMAYPSQGSPWADFLHHRARAFRWLRDELKRTPEEIAISMSCDPGQVRLVLMTVDQRPEEYEP